MPTHETILIQPNRPLLVRLVDPLNSANYDFEARQGAYITSTGQTLVLPRPAVLQLNELEPAAGEEIEILKEWSGRRGEPAVWRISRPARRDALPDQPNTPEQADEEPQEPPCPIRGPSRREPAREQQAGLFESRVLRPTGTGGPAPMPAGRAYAAPQLAGRTTAAPIPWNVAFREVSAWVAEELRNNHLQWSDVAQKNMVCTVLIAEAKKGRIGPWER